MSNLSIIPKAALLIHNGLIENVGPARRIENLAPARTAQEIDASGRIVLPAFVDPDIALVVIPRSSEDGDGQEDGHALRVMSRKRVLARAATLAAEYARYGSLTAGAHTRAAEDLKTVAKVLRTHHALQSKPLRIRSVFSPRLLLERNGGPATDALISRWLPAIRRKNLAAVFELPLNAAEPVLTLKEARRLASAAAALGFVIRIRSASALDAAAFDLALSAGVISVLAPCDPPDFITSLATMGCVFILTLPSSGDSDCPSATVRAAIDEGGAIAISSGSGPDGICSFNMQYLLHLAVCHFGFTPEEAITAATYNAASSLRISHVTGSLEPGKSADLLVMDIPDYRDLARRPGHSDISIAMRAGHIVFRNSH